MKKINLMIICIFTALLFTSCQSEGKQELNILTWADYVPNEVVLDFENETGIKVNYSNFSTNDEMLAKLEASKGGQYDVIICSDYIIDIMRKKENLIKELDTSKIENLKNIEEEFKNKYYDPENKYSIPYSASSALIVYDSAKVDFEIKGYKDLWNEKLKDSIVLLDGDRDIIGLTLQKMGYSVNETDKDILNKAKDDLLKLKPAIIGFDANKPHEMMISGEASVGYMFGSQATAVMNEIPTLKFVFPEEGMGFYIDNVVVPYNAPNSDNAYKFINYILDGKVSAKISSTINYINTNSAAKEFLPEEFLNNTAINIPKQSLEKAEVYMDIGEAKIEYDRIWTEFKSN